MIIYKGYEHQVIDKTEMLNGEECTETFLPWCKVPDFHRRKDENDKGLKLTLNQTKNENNAVRADYIIGVQWLKRNQDIVKVKPKKGNIDFFKILDSCLQDPVVGQHMDQCYAIHTEEPKIPVEKHFSDILNIFLVHHFLKLVEQITKRGLRKDFTRVSENLTAKIRGKISVNETIKYNHTKGRPDKVFCQYQKFTVDCLENQILAATLDAIQRRLKSLGQSFTEWTKLLKQLLPYFDGVQRISLHPGIFKKIKTSRFHRDYNQALDVAEQIYKNVTQTTEVKEKTTYIHPFLIDMPELFERYCEALLRCNYSNIEAGYENKGASEYYIGTNTPNLRPDFILKGETENYIIDSKYKFWYEDGKFEYFKGDYQQLALYGRHCGILSNFNDPEKTPKLVFIYPNIPEQESSNGEKGKLEESQFKVELKDKQPITGFCEMYKLSIDLPVLDSK